MTNPHRALSNTTYDNSVKFSPFSGTTTSTIAIFLPSLVGGGAERVMLNLAIALSQEGQSVDLVLATATGPYLSQVPSEVNIVDLKQNRTLASLPALIRYLRKTRPKAIISALDHANLVAIWAKYLAIVPTKVTVTVHNNLNKLMSHADAKRGKVIPSLMRLFFPTAHKIIAVSDGVGEGLLTTLKLPSEKITTIYNPVISDDLLAKANADIEHPWLRSGNTPVIMGIGRLDPQKDFPTLITAFATLRKQREAKLIILGEGQKRQELEALIKKLNLSNDVDLPGFVDNPYAYLSKVNLFVLSSIWEGLPTVLIEALALNIPVVATDCESGPKEILKDGKHGRLIPVGNSEALAKAMYDALQTTTHPDNHEIIEQYTYRAAARNYLQVIHQ